MYRLFLYRLAVDLLRKLRRRSAEFSSEFHRISAEVPWRVHPISAEVPWTAAGAPYPFRAWYRYPNQNPLRSSPAFRGRPTVDPPESWREPCSLVLYPQLRLADMRLPAASTDSR